MKIHGRLQGIAFLVFGCALLSCSTINDLLIPPTPTATSTSTPTATLTPTASPTIPAYPTADELVGTRWLLVYDAPEDGHREYDIVFHADGRLQTFHPNDRTPENDTWELEGSQITMCMNDCYAVYTGEFLDYDTMAGTTENVKGKTWDWIAHRKEPG